MSQELAPQAIEQVLMTGDIKQLTPEQRLAYYKSVCDSVGLNPLTRPFEYITLNGKLTLYAKRDATDQLRSARQVSVRIVSREVVQGVYVVTARATQGGREDESTGAVNIANLKGDALANAMMKAETKAKRRVTLSICGLGMLDESEVHSASVKLDDRPPAPLAIENGQTTSINLDADPVPDVADQIDRIESLHHKLEWPDDFSKKILVDKFGVNTVHEMSQEQLNTHEQNLVNTLERRTKKVPI